MRGIGATQSRPAVRPAVLLCVGLTGAALGTAWDVLHVWTGTTAYSIGPDRVPLWVPLEFGLVYLAGVLGISAFGSPRPDERSAGRLATEAVWLTVVYAMTAVLHRYEWLVAALALAGIALRRRTFGEVVRRIPLPAIALVSGGVIVETILIAAGIFDYANASLGKVAVWLPLLYANAVPFGVRLTETALWVSRAAERRPA